MATVHDAGINGVYTDFRVQRTLFHCVFLGMVSVTKRDRDFKFMGVAVKKAMVTATQKGLSAQ